MSFMDKVKKASRVMVDTGAKTILKVSIRKDSHENINQWCIYCVRQECFETYKFIFSFIETSECNFQTR